MNSPLGQYAQIVAAIAAVGIIGTYLVGTILGSAATEQLWDITLIAVGAVFGSAAGVNGWKRDVQALHTRLDKVAPPAGDVG